MSILLDQLCPDRLPNTDLCTKKICQYKVCGGCSLDLVNEDKENSIESIADSLQISRHRVWRIFTTSLEKIVKKDPGYGWKIPE